ncbi:Capsular polysaccharide biosynthesis protein-like protein [Methylobacterium sp. 4-46]|uniref:glycosyltransferase family 61 protein n=1 Tax=unclassified Methylobacterium TaxID=2615210 RepID=UPI000152D07C|nr:MULTISPECIES: glycosyltransferase family 61 protein [Methylobacterium]ACA17531.1 Capsular polysaccharide biosynthesis protein-like protein [Methylobacterium sp. 4-46]WFT83211.1 glycosyltransferase family 61 protein [Methylobacterium nodulans]
MEDVNLAASRRESLDQIGLRLGTLRASNVHDYLRRYEALLRPKLSRPIKILDLSLLEITGARALAEFIETGLIVVSVGPEREIPDLELADHPRLLLTRGDCRDPAYLCSLHAYGPFDLILENDRHVVEDQLIALEYLFPALAPGGSFVFESAFASTAETPRLSEAGITGIIDVARDLGTSLTAREPRIRQFDDEIVTKALDAVIFERSNITLRRTDKPKNAPVILHAKPFAEIGDGVVEALESKPYTRTDPVVQTRLAWMTERLLERVGKVEHPPAGQIGTVSNAIIFGEGIIVDRAGRLVVESLMNERDVPRLPYIKKLHGDRYAMLDHDQVEHLSGENIVAVKQRWDTNYGHWLVETLPRVGLLAERMPLDSCKLLITAWSDAMASVMRQSLVLCGATNENILQVSGAPLSVDKLIYVTPISSHPFVFHPYSARFLRSLAVKHMERIGVSGAQPTKVYVSRNKGNSRRIVNEDEIAAILTSRGYRIVYPENHTFYEQLEIFANCTHIVGNLGAALTNVAFARDGVGLLALASEFMPDDFFWDLTSQRGGRYFSIHGTAVEKHDEGHRSEMNAWFVLDIPNFVEMLDRFEAEVA